MYGGLDDDDFCHGSNSSKVFIIKLLMQIHKSLCLVST
jgi:hypothetical protein